MADVLALFLRYQDDVYRFALSYTRSREEAEDICQTVFEQLLTHPNIAPGREKACLMQTCANRCKNLLRSHWWQRTEALDETQSAPSEADSPVKQAVLALKPAYRAVVY